MKNFIKSFILIVLSNCLTGCGNDSPAPEASRHEKIAGAYCECTTRLIDLNKQAAGLASDSSAQANFSQVLQQIQSEYDKTKECASTIVGQYGKQKAEDLALVEKALAIQCADRVEQKNLLRELIGE